MKNTSTKNSFEEYIKKSDKDLKQSLQKNLEIDEKVQQILKEFQLNENDLSQKLLEFEYIVDEIKGLKNYPRLRLLSFRENPADSSHPNYGLYSGEDLFLNKMFP